MSDLTATQFTSKLQNLIKETDKSRLSKEQKRILEKEINEMLNHAIDRVLLSV